MKKLKCILLCLCTVLFFSVATACMPDGVLTVGSYAFDRCNKATTISIGSGVTRIEEYTFIKTSSTATNLTLGKNITYLDKNAFHSNTLQPITFNGRAEDWLAIEKANNWCTYFQVHCTEDGKYLNSQGVEYTP